MTKLPLFWPKAARKEAEELKQAGLLDEQVVEQTDRTIRRNLIMWSIGAMFFFVQGAQIIVLLLVLLLVPAMRYDVRRFLSNRNLRRAESSEQGVQ